MWRAPSDPQIYGAIDLDAAPVSRLIEDAKAQGVRLTPTVVVATPKPCSSVPSRPDGWPAIDGGVVRTACTLQPVQVRGADRVVR